MRGESSFGSEASHRLVTEEQNEERPPVSDKRAPAAERNCDHKQCENNPLGIDRDASPQHHPEDQREVQDASGENYPGTARRRLPVSGCGQQPPPQSRRSQKREARSLPPPPAYACRPRPA